MIALQWTLTYMYAPVWKKKKESVQLLSVSTLTQKPDANTNMCHIEMWLPRLCLAVFISSVIGHALPCELDPVTQKWAWVHRHMDRHMRSHMGADIVIFLFAVNKARKHCGMERVIPVSCTSSSALHGSATYHFASPIFGLMICFVSSFHFLLSHIPSDHLFPFNFHTRALFFFFRFNPLTSWIILLCWSTHIQTWNVD